MCILPQTKHVVYSSKLVINTHMHYSGHKHSAESLTVGGKVDFITSRLVKHKNSLLVQYV